MDNKGCVYAIQAHGIPYVKIGSTKGHPGKRLKELQTGQPFTLSLLAFIEVDGDQRALERKIHCFLREKKQRGEWFDIVLQDNDALAALIVEAMNYVEPPLSQESPMEGFGQRVILRRDRHGWNRRELARRAGLNEFHLAKIERGERHRIEGETIIKLARALGCTSDYLLGLTDDDVVNDEAQVA